MGASIGWFPIAGALVGALLVTLDACGRFILDLAVVNALLVAALVAITGALHLDGVIDTIGGVVAGPGRGPQLTAMHDAHASPAGAVAGCLLIYATYAAVTALPMSVRATALFIAPIAGRTAILLGYRLFPYARPEPGSSQALKAGATPFRTAVGVAAATGMAAGVATIGGVTVLLVALLPGLILARFASRHFRGLTGDILGAICETSQIAALLAAPLLQIVSG